jgi:hypothetical protein
LFSPRLRGATGFLRVFAVAEPALERSEGASVMDFDFGFLRVSPYYEVLLNRAFSRKFPYRL